MEDDAHSLPYSLRQRMSRPEERSGYEQWWGRSSFGSMASGPLSEPVHDLGVVSIIEEGDEATLEAAIREYLSSDPPENSFVVALDVQNCTWDMIFDEIGHAKKVYEQKGDGNPIRRCFRHGQGFQRNIRPLAEVIPGENGVGLIKGGLHIVLNAIQRRTATCEKIYEQFESIPRCIRHAECLQDMHRRSPVLNAALRDLYLALVRCLPALIQILLREENHSRLKKFSNAFFKDSAVQVDLILKPLKEAESRLEECQRELVSQGIVHVVELSQVADQKHDATRQELELVTRRLTEVQNLQAGLPSAVRDSVEDSFKGFSNIIRDQVVQQMKNHHYIFMQEQLRMNDFIQAHLQSQTSIASITSLRKDARMELLESLCTDRERRAPTEDRSSVLQKYHSFRAKGLARSNQLLSHPRFSEWVGVLHSDILLVNGHVGGEMIGSTSALSIFCAGLIETFGTPVQDPMPQSPYIIAEYFAGQHETASSGLEGPHGLLRSLIHQVLSQWPGNVPLTLQARRNESFLEAYEWSIMNLCQLFESIICQLPREFPIWCIIDNVSHFETSYNGWDRELDEIVEFLDRYVDNGRRTGGISAPLKILMTAARRSVNICELLPPDAEVNLRDDRALTHMRGSQGFQALLQDN